ncbi:MAG: ATP-binding protein [Terracidiphilus sp.]
MKLPTFARWASALLMMLLTTVVLTRFGASASTAGMMFLAIVVWTAAQTGIVLALTIAFLAALVFDYFFLPPYRTFMLAGAGDWLSMLSFLVCSVVTGRVAERASSQARHAEQRREDVERLYTLGQEMMLQDEETSLVHEIPRLIGNIFGLESVVLYVHDHDEFHAAPAEFPADLQAALRQMGTESQFIPHVSKGYAAQMLMLGLRPVGAICWKPDKLTVEVAAAMGAQVAIALTRAMALETTARVEAVREGERLRTALIDSLSHELRTPLTSIRAAATTLKYNEGLDDISRRELVEVVDDESKRLDALIGEAFEMSEIQAEVVRAHPTLQHVRAFLDHVMDELQPSLAGHKIRIEMGGPDRPVLFDPHLVSRVLRHLLENAARYTVAGSQITVRSRVLPGRLEFAIEDAGPGIDAVDLPLIFEKFYRGKVGKRCGKGTGMGLAIARAIARAHGGSIVAASEVGKGATFTFWVSLEESVPGNV